MVSLPLRLGPGSKAVGDVVVLSLNGLLILDSMRLEARLLRPVRSIGAEYSLRSLLFFGVARLMSWCYWYGRTASASGHKVSAPRPGLSAINVVRLQRVGHALGSWSGASPTSIGSFSALIFSSSSC